MDEENCKLKKVEYGSIELLNELMQLILIHLK